MRRIPRSGSRNRHRVLIDAKVPVFSFVFGIPPEEILDECRTNGIVIVGTATTPDEAVVLSNQV